MSAGSKKPIFVPLDAIVRLMLNAEVAGRQRKNPDTIIHRTDLVREALDFWFQRQGQRREREGFPPCVFEAMNMKVEVPPEAFR